MNRLLTSLVVLLCLLPGAALSQTGIVGESLVSQCDEQPYTITVLNDTGTDIDTIEVTNILPSGFSYVGGSSFLTTTGTTPACTSSADPGSSVSRIPWDLDALCGGSFILEDGGIIIQY